MSGPSFHLRWPPRSLFKFPPDPDPPALPPARDDRTFASPFGIDPTTYNNALSVWVPITIATTYAVTVAVANAINRRRGNKPWAISKTKPFRAFVILHNIALALFSALTFVAMIRALRHSWPGWHERNVFGISWPAWRTENGLAGAADALCKLHGPRGLGDAAYYNPVSKLWEIKNRLIHLGDNRAPDPTDVGRIWNEGLAFWGWFFYLSKFYELLDTTIILLKGKRSSTLQTYHHAGAMFCMWAGIRYISPPIWMFVFLNSAIHAMMYTYYTLSALGVRVPQSVKRALTTMQIAQFLIGFTFAAAHLFVYYTVPVSTPYTFMTTVKSAASAVSSAASSVINNLAAPTVTAGVGNFLKKLAFRAAGEEGLAENVRNSKGQLFGPEGDHVVETVREETRYRNEYHEVPCIDTSGQAFAIWLNLFYLLPLTALFARFFIRSYTRRASSSTKHPTQRHRLSKASKDAAHGVDREIEHLGQTVEEEISSIGSKVQNSVDKRKISQTIEKFERQAKDGYDSAAEEVKHLGEKAKKGIQDLKTNGSPLVERAKDVAGDLRQKGAKAYETAQKKGEEAVTNGKAYAQKAKEKARPYYDDTMEKADEAARMGKQKAEDMSETAKEKAQEYGAAGKEKAQEYTEAGKDKARDYADSAKSKAEEYGEEGKKKAQEAGQKAQDAGEKAKETAQDVGEDAKDKTKETADQARDKAEETKDQTRDKVKETKDAAKDEANKKKEDVESTPSRGQKDEHANKDDSSPPQDEQIAASTGIEPLSHHDEHPQSYHSDQRQPHRGEPLLPDHSRHAPQGLSTDDPHEVGLKYSDWLKKK